MAAPPRIGGFVSSFEVSSLSDLDSRDQTTSKFLPVASSDNVLCSVLGCCTYLLFTNAMRRCGVVCCALVCFVWYVWYCLSDEDFPSLCFRTVFLHFFRWRNQGGREVESVSFLSVPSSCRAISES